MANTSLDINTDVLAHILLFVSSPRDLLSFGLANKQLFSLANPELLYRSVQCRLRNNAVWEHLIANPAQASRVRELEVLRENHSRPRIEMERAGSLHLVDHKLTMEEISARQTPRWEDVERSERLLIQALKILVNLESFKWDRWVPVVNQGDGLFSCQGYFDDAQLSGPIYEEDIWTALRDYTQVRRIRVVDLGRTNTIVPNPRNIYRSKAS